LYIDRIDIRYLTSGSDHYVDYVGLYRSSYNSQMSQVFLDNTNRWSIPGWETEDDTVYNGDHTLSTSYNYYLKIGLRANTDINQLAFMMIQVLIKET